MKHLNQIDKAFVLKKSFLFQDLNLEQLFAISSKIDCLTIEQDEYIFREKQKALHIYMIASGTVELISHDKKQTISLSKGAIFGDEALLNDLPHQYEAKGLSKCQLLGLTKKHLSIIISECPSVAMHLLEAFAKKTPFRHEQKENPSYSL